MKLSEVYKIADGLAPKRLSDEYCAVFGAYDNSGLLVEACEEVKGILFSLDLTNAAIEKAIKKGCNLIITHHPAIYGKIGDIRMGDNKLLGGKLVRCIQNGISVICMHLNLDTAKDGIDENLMQGILRSSGAGTGLTTEPAIMHPLQDGGYGRAYDMQECTLSTLAEKMKTIFATERILTYGEQENTVKRAASFCGAGVDESSIAFAAREGAQVLVSSDFKHHLIALALELGMSVVILTHYASENYGFKKYYEKICRQVEIPCVYHTDDNLL